MCDLICRLIGTYFGSKNHHISDATKVPAYVPSAYISRSAAKRRHNLADVVSIIFIFTDESLGTIALKCPWG